MLVGRRILVAPLDWGLGHAARCVPIIRALLQRQAVPVIGADGGALALLRGEFPRLAHVRVPGVTVHYARGRDQLWTLARQFPGLLRSIGRERSMLRRLRDELHLDAVISDNRFGLHMAGLPSVLITHQVFPFTPMAQGVLRRVNRAFIDRFDACWIMDEPVAPGLAGDLAHGPALPRNARYIGPMSRLHAPTISEPAPYRVVAVISGPEPQRTLLEDALRAQLQHIEGRHLIVRGLPSSTASERGGAVECVPHLDADALGRVLAGCTMIVGRSGYTTIMDLTALGRSALLIPTPGQPEQEYLGALHASTGRFLVQAQHAVDLAAALKDPRVHRRMPAATPNVLLDEALDALGRMLR